MKMNGGRSDASTSTDDVKSRPLCLFYFTHPFGVLSAEPPTLAAAPPHIARAFLNMQPVPPWTLWSPGPPAPAPPSAAAAPPSDDDYCSGSSSRPDYELGAATVHRTPLSLVSVTRTRKCTLDFGDSRDSISSSLFSNDMWFNTSAGGRITDYPRRLVPYNKILPPLQLPSPKDSSNPSSSEDFWPKKCLNPEKFSLPPIELPSVKVNIVRSKKCSASSEEASGAECGGHGRRRRLGVSKPRRARAADLRRLLAARMRRALAGGAERNVSPALRDALNTIREAWAEPRSLLSRCRTVHRACEESPAPRAPPPPMERAAAELPPRAGVSPGMMRRRYSVPETIMRKYRLAQQRSDSEESAPPTNRSVASASPPRDTSGSPGDSPQRFLRRDRELMRKSALMRRLWGRPCEPGRACCCCGAEPCVPAPYSRETRSLDGSRSELRPLSSPSSRHSHQSHATGWATPKRQRLDSERDCRGSDEMLRTARNNTYNRAEESRIDRATRPDFSDSTYQSHGHEPSLSYLETVTDAFTDSDGSKFNGNAFTLYSEQHSSDTTTLEVNSHPAHSAHVSLSSSRPLSASSDTCSASASYPTTKESAHITGHVCERSASLLRDDNDAVPYDQPLCVHTCPPSYELLEIVLSETLNVSAVPAVPPDKATHHFRAPTVSQKCAQSINIDEYVSNILVESLNSLTDQLECMNASIGNDRKISIVEKEIKVKLQNTGVNTIVHLSPTSNNQIIFGNEELCINEERKDRCKNPHDMHVAHDTHDAHDALAIHALAIRDEAHSVESNNNLTSAGSPGPCPCDSFDLQHDNVNQAVLQQIQKLFQDELHNLDPDMNYSGKTMPEISHIEISNVTDVFIDNENEPGPPGQAHDEYEVISGVGAGSYYPAADEQPMVPRFSAFPHTDSMEVNTSSSEDADLLGSDCTSLVDSLDDPNSPRAVLLRRACTPRRTELVRSSIDVLELLPENMAREDAGTPKDKGEAFFIKIKDNECDCEKENVNVADRMPEKIKQRLYRRHRKREMRMESARRTRGKQCPRERDREVERRLNGRGRARRDVTRECVAIVNALIDDVISRVAQDEYRCMRLRHRPANMRVSKSDNNVAKRTWKKQLEPIDDRDPFKYLKSNTAQYDSYNSRKHKGERHQIHGKLSFVTRPPVASDDRAAKRIYQKSEIHEGNKCIEILEILEYVNGSQSSPETTTSDENQNHNMKNKKSRIPIPIYEKIQKTPNNEPNRNSSKRSSMQAEHNGNTNRLIADMLLGALAESASKPRTCPSPSAPSVRSRSNSLRFKQTFDIIPEERSSLSHDSGNEDLNHNRRASAPDVAEQFRELSRAPRPIAPPAPAPTPRSSCSPPHRLQPPPDSPRQCRDTKSAATSPITESDGDKRSLSSKNQTTMTSPSSKSAATSPMRAGEEVQTTRRTRAWPARTDAGAPHAAGYKERAESDKVRPRRSVITQHERAPNMRAGSQGGARPGCAERAQRPPRAALHPPPRARPSSAERALLLEPSDCSPDDISNVIDDKRKSRRFSLERSDEDGIHAPSVKLPEFKGGGDSGGATSSDSSESGGSLLCSLAPKWLSQGRARRAARRREQARASPTPHDPQPPGGWSVTVAGSCRAALPADVEMRLRFPHDELPAHVAHSAHAAVDGPCQECTCRHCATCACSARGPRGAPPLPPALARHSRTDSSKLTLTMKKEAHDSSILASKSTKKAGEPLPDVETYRASRSKLKSSVKTRRGYSLHCWLPDAEAAPIRPSNGLSVLGSAIIPELKPRVPTMSERDLTRVYTPRHYLRS